MKKKIFRFALTFLSAVLMLSSFCIFSFAANAVKRPVITQFTAEPKTKSITLSWESQQEADGYRLYQYSEKKGRYVVLFDDKENTYTLSKLQPGTKYQFAVKAYIIKENGSKYYSASVKNECYTKIDKVKNLTLVKSESNKQKISWSEVTNADGYEVYYLNASTGKYKLLGTTKKTCCSFSKLKSAKSYTYKVRAFVNKDDETLLYGKYSATLTAVTKPQDVQKFKAADVTTSSFTLTWEESEGAQGYKIYIYNDETGKFEAVKTVKNALSYTVSGLPSGSTYAYKIRSYSTVDSKRYYSAYSDILAVSTKPEQTTVTQKRDFVGYGTVILEWTQVQGAAGYLVYVSEHKNSGFTLKKTVKGGKNVSCKLTSLKNAKPLYVKVKAYILTNGKYTYASNSKLVTVYA